MPEPWSPKKISKSKTVCPRLEATCHLILTVCLAQACNRKLWNNSRLPAWLMHHHLLSLETFSLTECSSSFSGNSWWVNVVRSSRVKNPLQALACQLRKYSMTCIFILQISTKTRTKWIRWTVYQEQGTKRLPPVIGTWFTSIPKAIETDPGVDQGTLLMMRVSRNSTAPKAWTLPASTKRLIRVILNLILGYQVSQQIYHPQTLRDFILTMWGINKQTFKISPQIWLLIDLLLFLTIWKMFILCPHQLNIGLQARWDRKTQLLLANLDKPFMLSEGNQLMRRICWLSMETRANRKDIIISIGKHNLLPFKIDLIQRPNLSTNYLKLLTANTGAWESLVSYQKSTM